LIKAPENNKISDKELEEMETLARRMNNEIDFPKKDEERYNELKGKKVERFDTNFKSSHRSEPNVLAHLRLNERTYN